MNQLLEETLESCSNLLGGAKHVEIDADKLDELARENALREFELPTWDTPLIYPASHDAFVSHCFWVNVINFCYGHCEPGGSAEGKIRKFQARDTSGKMWSGAYAAQATLYRLFGDKKILASDMRRVIGSYSRFKQNFHGASSTLPLQRRRYEMLRETCVVLETSFGGDPAQILRQADYRAFSDKRGKPGVVELLAGNFPHAFGEDRERIPGVGHFFFLKRAQLFAVMYHARAVHSGGELQPLSDPGEIGPITDYQLPKSYVADGIFRYRDWLKRKIDKAVPLRAGSLAEVEIRAATFWAHTRELEVINETREEHELKPIHIGHLDYYRWVRGRKDKSNHHLCLTTNY